MSKTFEVIARGEDGEHIRWVMIAERWYIDENGNLIFADDTLLRPCTAFASGQWVRVSASIPTPPYAEVPLDV